MIQPILSAIQQKHSATGITINPPASVAAIERFERNLGFELPADFKEFYSICDGFECEEDQFIMVPLYDILMGHEHNGKDYFHFAEYMTYSDMWAMRIKEANSYEIFNLSYTDIILTSSLQEFLSRFLQGNVFDKGGLYDWHDEVKAKTTGY